MGRVPSSRNSAEGRIQRAARLAQKQGRAQIAEAYRSDWKIDPDPTDDALTPEQEK